MQVKLNVKSVPRNLEKLGVKKRKEIQAQYKEVLSKVAQVGVNIILDRTAQGKGYKGGRFEKYTAKYAQERAKAGRSKAPNLNFTGKMLGSMTTVSSPTKAFIFLRGEEARKASGNNKKRPFFGFSRRENKRLAKAFERFLVVE